MKARIEDLRGRLGSLPLEEMRDRAAGFSLAGLLDRLPFQRRRRQPPPILWLAAGFVLGLVLGGVLAFMFDPHEGEDRRRRLVASLGPGARDGEAGA
ncbi:MAG TPA: hypothetical protein VK131_10880 [Candidatus Acidoferrales bacterium]|nr:hypothetical protein [Candidatus Acidoferrales bacterium]